MNFADLKTGMLVVWSDDLKSIFLKDTPQGDVFAAVPGETSNSAWFAISDYTWREYFRKDSPVRYIVSVYDYQTNMLAFENEAGRKKIYPTE